MLLPNCESQLSRQSSQRFKLIPTVFEKFHALPEVEAQGGLQLSADCRGQAESSPCRCPADKTNKSNVATLKPPAPILTIPFSRRLCTLCSLQVKPCHTASSTDTTSKSTVLPHSGHITTSKYRHNTEVPAKLLDGLRCRP